MTLKRTTTRLNLVLTVDDRNKLATFVILLATIDKRVNGNKKKAKKGNAKRSKREGEYIDEAFISFSMIAIKKGLYLLVGDLSLSNRFYTSIDRDTAHDRYNSFNAFSGYLYNY